MDTPLAEYEGVISEALKLARLDWSYIYALEQSGMSAFLRAIPTVFAHLEQRRLRHEAVSKAWQVGDPSDLIALAPAIVYCDVVVTERMWTDLARRAGLDTLFHTTVVPDLDSLAPLLIDASQAA